MKAQIGLKIFSSNTQSIPETERLFSKGLLDYVEIFAFPGSFKDTARKWKKVKAPFVVHAPHGQYGFSLSQPEKRKSNLIMFEEARKFADLLGAEEIIIHPGLTGDQAETIKQIKGLKDERLVVENMPFVSLLHTKCMGSTPEQMDGILASTGAGFCLDIVHCIKSAFAHGVNASIFILQFLALNPQIIHFCDTTAKGCFDEHMGLEKGDVDLKNIISYLQKTLDQVKITLETPESSFEKLTDYKKNRNIVGKLMGNKK